MEPLRDCVALVTGASRGAGRGIAVVLGDLGATVYVTGRSVRGEPTTAGRRPRWAGSAGRYRMGSSPDRTGTSSAWAANSSARTSATCS